MDRTIHEMQQQNAMLRQKLGRLVREGEDEDTDVQFVRLLEGGKENRWKSLRENVERINRQVYELPERKPLVAKEDNEVPVGWKQEPLPRKSAVMKPAPPIVVDDDYSDPLETEIDNQRVSGGEINSDTSRKLHEALQQLHTERMERQDLIEEFQHKEADFYRTLQERDNHWKHKVDKLVATREAEFARELQLKQDKLDSLQLKHIHNEQLLKDTVRKMSLQLLENKRDLNVLTDRNEALRQVNLVQQQLGTTTASANNAHNNNSAANNNVNMKVPSPPETTMQLLAGTTGAASDDTADLIHSSDDPMQESTTEYLIHGPSRSRTMAPGTIARVHDFEPPKNLRSFLLAVMFISRLRLRMQQKHRLDQRLHEAKHANA